MASKIEISYVKEYELCDRNHFYAVKGISILAALFAYVASIFYRIPNMKYITFAATMVFVLCSGYGLSESYSKKRGLVHYWENKMLKVWLPSLVILMVTSLIDKGMAIGWIAKTPLALKGNILYVIFGGYAAFWLMFQLSDKRAVRLIGLLVISLAALFLMPENLAIRELVLGMPLGVAFSQLGWKYKVRKFKWLGKTILLLTGAAAAVGAWFLAGMVNIPYVTTAIWSVFYMAVAATLIFAVWIFRAVPVFGIFVPFGMASYGFYLLYDSVFPLLEGRLNWKSLVVVSVVLCLAAAVLTVLRELLVAWNKNLRRKGKTHLKGSMW